MLNTGLGNDRATTLVPDIENKRIRRFSNVVVNVSTREVGARPKGNLVDW